VLSYEIAQLLPAQLGIDRWVMLLGAFEGGWLCFHWLGDVYGRALLDLLSHTVKATLTESPGICLFVPEELRAIPRWTPQTVERYLMDTTHHDEGILTLRAYQALLPRVLRQRSVVEQFWVSRFLEVSRGLTPTLAPETLIDGLQAMLCLTPR